MKHALFFNVLLVLASCISDADKPNERKVVDDPYFSPGFDYVHMIPDSVRTAEQNEFLERLQAVIDEHLQSKNNELVFVLSKEAFVAKGFPEEYYMLIQKDLENNNTFFKANGLDVDSILAQSRK